MHFKSFVSMGVAAVLIVPTLITAANPELAYAKTTSSKKVSAKAKSVIAKIKAIDPKKSNYVTKTKSAVNAYKKLSSKEKKMVYNYGTLKKHWTNVQNRKAKQVIASIKAINPKKSDYVLKTKSALSAYNKLSKTDKKKVTNYSTLKKHWKNIQPYLKKVDAFNKSVATLSKTNFTTKSVTLEKQYDNLDSITKAAVPSTTLKKLNYYADVVETKKMVFSTLDTGSTTTTPTADSTDGSVILNIINAYKKLSGAQQTLLRDLLDDNNENEEKRLDRYLALEDVVKTAVGIEKKYAALKPANPTKYAKDLVALYTEYKATAAEPKRYMPHNNEIANIGNVYKQQIDDAKKFTEIIDQLDAGAIPTNTVIETIKNLALAPYTLKGKSDSNSNYPVIAPIDLVDAKVVTAYNKYKPIPEIVDRFNQLPLLIDVTAGRRLLSSEVSNMADLLAQYKKLGANQKTIVQNLIPTKIDYLSEDKNISKAQAIDKSYDSALKNKNKPSYYNDLLKAFNAYDSAPPEVQRFVVNATASAIKGIPTNKDYLAALDKVKDFKDKVNVIPNATFPEKAIANATAAYNTVASNPAWLALVDKNTLKTYLEYAKVPAVLKSVAKILVTKPYKSNDVLSVIKDYKKLGEPQKQIVDTSYPSFGKLVDDEANIKEAKKIDDSYLKLKKSSKTYPSDAKKVFTSYDDATDDVKKYVANSGKISTLFNTFSTEQQRVSHFEDLLVKPLSKKSTVKNVEDAVDYYTYHISPEPRAISLVDKAIMKKYNQYAPISDVVKMFSLIKESTVTSPTVTPTDAKYIQKVIKAYNALGPDQQMIVDNENRSKYPFLEDAEEITAAEVIDKAFEKIKPTDDKYEIEVLDVYYNLYDRALPIVKKYVANKATLEEVGDRYKPQLNKAREFETMVTDMSHVSQKGNTPGVLDVRKLEKYYEDNIKYNIINAKYNVALQTLIDPNIMAEYEKYLPILQIQDIAKSIYVQYGKLLNYDNNNKNPIGYTDTGKVGGTPIKITNPNDINSIYKAIEMYNKLESPQRAILDKAPKFLGDHEYEDKYNIPYKGDHKEEEVIRPSIPLSDDEIKNFLKAQEIDKEYEALNPSSKTYIQDAIALYYKFVKAEKKVQIYVVHEDDIKAIKDSYQMESIFKGIDEFVKSVGGLPGGVNDSIDNQIKNGKAGVVDQYNKLNEAQLAVLDKGVLTKYNAYAPIAEIMELTGKIDSDKNGKYIDSDIDKMIKAIAIYKKLSKDPKSLVIKKINSTPLYQYLNHEKEIKAAQKVDTAFKKLDKSDDKYVTDLKKVETAFDALKDLKLSGFTDDKDAQVYVTSKDEIKNAIAKDIYSKPKVNAKSFKDSVEALLDLYPITYQKVKNLVDMYKSLSSKAKSLVDSDTLKIYNKYAPIVEIVETLKEINVPDTTEIDKWAELEKGKSDLDLIIKSPATGYYKENSPKDVGSVILNAIQLYNKLGSDQKDIVLNKVQPANPGDSNGLTNKQIGLLYENNNIKAAQELDKKIAAIKPKSTGFVKGVIDATKTLNVMPIEQRIYLQNVNVLKGYLEDSKAQETQTQKAIKDLQDFETGVDNVEELSSDAQSNKQSIIDQLKVLVNLYKKLNTPRLIDGAETKLSTLIDRNKLARYQYFISVYDIMNLIKKN